jgi:hypothetical protein
MVTTEELPRKISWKRKFQGLLENCREFMDRYFEWGYRGEKFGGKRGKI